MNTRQIQPVTVWTPNGQRTATIFSIYDFYGYHFDNGGGMVKYKLIGMEIGGDNVESAVDYINDTYPIPPSIVQQWCASDDIIFTYVAQQLGLVII